MTEFAKACKQIEGILESLQLIEQNSCWGGHQPKIDEHRSELYGPLAEKMQKFRARVEEPDADKRTYGPSMEAKVRKCVQDYEALLQKFAEVSTAVAINHEDIAANEIRAEQIRQQLRQLEELEDSERTMLERSQQGELQELRKQQLTEAALVEEDCRRQLVARKQERERLAHVAKEFEARHELELVEKHARQKLEEDLHARRQREETREEKRRRMETLLQQHRLVKEKGERQLIAEAVALSLQEGSSSSAPAAERAVDDKMDIDPEPPQPPAPESAPEIPPAADLETEEMLIKQAIELSLQLSATAQLTNCRETSKRADNTPDAPQP